jgi:hypothetical protein
VIIRVKLTEEKPRTGKRNKTTTGANDSELLKNRAISLLFDLIYIDIFYFLFIYFLQYRGLNSEPTP